MKEAMQILIDGLKELKGIDAVESELINKLVQVAEVAKQEQGDPVAFKQFLSDVHTAAGLVTHGRQCKASSSVPPLINGTIWSTSLANVSCPLASHR